MVLPQLSHNVIYNTQQVTSHVTFLGPRPYQEIVANVQHTMLSDYGSPLALEPRPQGNIDINYSILHICIENRFLC